MDTVDQIVGAWHKNIKGSGSDEIKNKVGDLQEGMVSGYSQEVLDMIITEIKKEPDFSKNARTLKLLIELKKAYWPATQTAIQAEVNLDDRLKEWWFAQQELKKMDKEREANLEKEKKKIIEIEAI